jgi:hypothetical protein
MQYSAEQVTSRREFFRAGARFGALALVSVVAGLVARPRKLDGQRCVTRGVCSRCDLFASCGLPQALSARRAGKEV